MQLNLRGPRVLIKPMTPTETTKSKIVIPDSAKKDSDSFQGLVIGVGPLVTGDTKVGQYVTYNGYAAEDVEIEGILHHIVQEESISSDFDPAA